VFLVIRLIKQKGRKWVLDRLANEGMALKNLYIDEAQDSDIVQNFLISVLAGGDDKSLNITVVGDMKQSIYQWRNAYPEEFNAMYKEAKALKCAEDLKLSWRVKNGENLKFLNEMFDRMSGASGHWEYEAKRDELEPNPDKIDPARKKKIRITRLFNDADFSAAKKDIEGFIKDGSCGILVEKKKYAQSSGITDMLSGIKQRIQIENNGKDGIMGTSLAERMMMTALLYSRLREKLQFMPYLLLFTTPGNFIRNMNREIKGAVGIEELFKSIKRFMDRTYETYRESGTAKSAYSLLEKYGLWKYMFHGDASGPDTIPLASVRRGINTMLASMHLGERAGDTPIYGREDMVADTLESDASPFEWFGLPGRETKAGDRELTTIHSSKGLQYDNVLVFSDIMARLKPETDFSDDEYGFLYYADFKDILTDNPKVSVDFYPYLGNLPCKIIKFYYNEQKAPWKQGLAYYQNTARKVISENYNVLYVAFTRAKDGLW
ncbi:MAG TPA: UvrD-helicase domain-containing protein, partial [Candidatus Goldiibacteriota bacterium]|nr:UvrD-helicase domain-containing protein [Candidatus Goldiibacteriota bacterium]